MTHIPGTLTIYIAPMASGKSTFVRADPHTRADSDAAKDARFEPLLKALRRSNQWPAHNAVWHDLLAKWAASLPANIEAVTAHSLHDAVAIATNSGRPVRLAFISLSDEDRLQRRLKRTLSNEESALADLNLTAVTQAQEEHPSVPVLTDFPA